MKNIFHGIVFLILLGIDLYVMVTGAFVVSLIAFILGITVFTHYLFRFEKRVIDTKKD